jgi:hypothetical protein
MAMELYNTSAEKGLKPGSTGFCTVGMTAGMPKPMIRKLESLGGYRPAFDLGSPQAPLNPPAFVHSQVNIGGRIYSVLSHICFAGADHQGRFNKLAHHIVLDPEERGTAGPAWVMQQAGIMAKQWTGDARILPAGKAMPDGPNPLTKCDTWKQVAGDAGWAGMLAQSFVLDSSRSAYVIYPPGMDILPLVNESIALLPERLRWQVSFNTYFDTLPAGLSWTWRFCLAGSPAAKAAPSHATSGVLIDLTASPGMAPDNIYVQMARTGQPSQESTLPGTPQVSKTIIAPKSHRSSAANSTAVFASKTSLEQTADAEPVAEAAPEAQTATAVLPDYYEPPAPRRRTPIFWAAVLLWPILVLGGGGALIWAIQAQKTVAPPPVEAATVSELKEKLQKANTLATKWKKQHEILGETSKLEKDAAKKDHDTLKQRVTEAERQKAEKIIIIRDLESKIAKLEKSNATTAAGPNRPQPGDNGNTNGGNNSGNGNSTPVNHGAPASVDRSGVTKPIKLKSNNLRTLGGEQEICKAPKDSNSVTLIIPTALPEGFTAKEENLKFTVFYNIRNPMEKNTKNESLLTLEIKDGKIIATSKAISISHNQKTQIKNLEYLLRYAEMQVYDSSKKELLTRRFTKPENVDLALTKLKAETNLKIPFETLNPVVTITANGIWKTVEGQGTATPIARTNSGAELELTLLLEKTEKGTSFTAKWGKGSSVSEITAEMNALLLEARRIWEQVRKSEHDIDGKITLHSPPPDKGTPDTIISNIHGTLLQKAIKALHNPKSDFRKNRVAAQNAFKLVDNTLEKKRNGDIIWNGVPKTRRDKWKSLNGKVKAYRDLASALSNTYKPKLKAVLEKTIGLAKRKEDVEKYSELRVEIKAKDLLLAEGIVEVGEK